MTYPRMIQAIVVGALGLTGAACRGNVVTECASTGVSATGAGGASSTSSATSSSSGGGVCPAPKPPSAASPPSGCAENKGNGWVSVPCYCNLWLENTTAAPATATIDLTVTPPTAMPTLYGSLDVDIDFDDPDATWYAVWLKQPGNGTAFTVNNSAFTTTVRMGVSSLTLGAVPLAACETRKAIAHIIPGDIAPQLSMHATIEEGTGQTTVDAACSNPPLEGPAKP